MTGEERDEFLRDEVVVEEKVDGSSLGISVDEHGELQVQHRGDFLRGKFAGEYAELPRWIAEREEVLKAFLGNGRILFGEWCVARHTMRYQRLPDWFIAYDVFDRRIGRFWSSRRRTSALRSLGLTEVSILARGHFTPVAIVEMAKHASTNLGVGPAEGLYLRKESEDWLIGRAKVVRPDFVQNIMGHWTTRKIERNGLIRRPLNHADDI